MPRSTRDEAWRAALLLGDVSVALALILPTALVSLFLHVTTTILNTLRALIPSHISHLFNRFLHLVPPSTPSSSSSSSLLSTHFPPIIIRRHFVTVGSELRTTELLSIAPIPAPLPTSFAPLHFVLITGNPGTCHYYSAFVSTLHRLSGHSMHVSCMSLAGHQSAQTLHLHHHRRLYDLHDQVELWRSFLASLHSQYPHHRFIIAGHSIGAYIALQTAASALPPSQLLHFFLLFPTLSDMEQTPNGQRLRLLFAYGQTLAATLAWFALLAPARLLLALILLNLPPDTSSSDPSLQAERLDVARTTLDLLHPQVVRQALGLAAAELRDVRALDVGMMGSVREGKVTFIVGEDDGWNPAWQQDQVQRAYPQARMTRMERGVPHAFVVGSRRVAEEVWADINRLLADWDKQERRAINTAVYPHA